MNSEARNFGPLWADVSEPAAKALGTGTRIEEEDNPMSGRSRVEPGSAVWWVALTICMALVLAACGGSSDEATTTTSQAVTDSSEPETDTTQPGSDTTETTQSEPEEPQGEPAEMTLIAGGPLVQPSQIPFTSLPQSLFWPEENLDVELVALAGSVAALQALAAGEGDATMVATASLAQMLSSTDADVISIYNYSGNYLFPAVSEDSDIQEVADLAGKTLGVQSLEGGTIAVVKAMMAEVGADPDSVEFVVIGTGAEALAALQAGRVDGAALWDSQYAEFAALGYPMRFLSTPSFDNLEFQLSLVVRRDALDEDPDKFVRLARGIAKASLYAGIDPEDAVLVHWENENIEGAKPTGMDEDVALAIATSVLQVRLDQIQPVDGRWGWATTEQIQGALDVLGDAAAGVTPDDLYTSELIDAVNDFDHASVEAVHDRRMSGN